MCRDGEGAAIHRLLPLRADVAMHCMATEGAAPDPNQTSLTHHEKL